MLCWPGGETRSAPQSAIPSETRYPTSMMQYISKTTRPTTLGGNWLCLLLLFVFSLLKASRVTNSLWVKCNIFRSGLLQVLVLQSWNFQGKKIPHSWATTENYFFIFKFWLINLSAYFIIQVKKMICCFCNSRKSLTAISSSNCARCYFSPTKGHLANIDFQTETSLDFSSALRARQPWILTRPELPPRVVQADPALLLVAQEFMDDLHAAPARTRRKQHTQQSH